MKSVFHLNVLFCPHCGVKSIDRDMDKQGKRQNIIGQKQINNGTEWICRTCGFGFKITKSSKVLMAERILKDERKQRANCTFQEKSVGTEIAQAYLVDANKRKSELLRQGKTQYRTV